MRVQIDVTECAVCDRFHTLDQRLARSLLVAAVRAGTDAHAITHDVLASMVGSARHRATAALGTLRDAGSSVAADPSCASSTRMGWSSPNATTG